MIVKELLTRVLDSEAYDTVKGSFPDLYLAHFFYMGVENTILDPSHWQVGFYIPSSDKIVVFELKSDGSGGERVVALDPEDALKEAGHVEKLVVDNIKQSPADAKNAGFEVISDNYSSEKVNKIIMLLQVLDGVPLYNMTFVTDFFNLINVRVSAIDGAVISHNKRSIMSLRKE